MRRKWKRPAERRYLHRIKPCDLNPAIDYLLEKIYDNPSFGEIPEQSHSPTLLVTFNVKPSLNPLVIKLAKVLPYGYVKDYSDTPRVCFRLDHIQEIFDFLGLWFSPHHYCRTLYGPVTR